ncbi:hypothetical protein E6C27_scaffold274G004700 [Cucumis melo var. makuwa]|uniref:Uncharacterized protein n=1 Tax=Cucumis melo var. makuwa TaxID=1194695 RepID=A0A5A7UQK6_CUCMM|nr:hypothetical protein E6C27_scaffold274G004700 [Cucumis melo var. makuwa]
MTRKVLLRSQAVRHRSSLQDGKIDAPQERRQFAEVAGGSAAECTAVCCCCPWTVLNILIFSIYRMPAGLCRKAINRRKRHRRMKRKYLIQQRKAVAMDFTDGSVGPIIDSFGTHQTNDVADSEDLKKLEEEMWGRFSQTGFWRTSGGHGAAYQKGKEKKKTTKRGILQQATPPKPSKPIEGGRILGSYNN